MLIGLGEKWTKTARTLIEREKHKKVPNKSLRAEGYNR